MFREFIKNGYRHPHANTLSECLEWAAAKCTKGINFYTFDGKSTFLSYNDILEKAKIWAGTLRKKNINGSVIICIDDPETFTITLWACIISGIVVVPIEGLRNAEIQSGDYSRICNICKQHPGCVIASDSDNIAKYEIMAENVNIDIKCINADELKHGKPVEVLHNGEDDCVMVQYSSGSTGNPKGVMMTNKNIMTSMGSSICIVEPTSNDKAGIWSPLFHNMGLFIHIEFMQICADMYMFPPALFIQNPTRYLDICSEKGITLMVSNNFGLEWMIKNVNTENFTKDYLKHIHTFIVASEVVVEDTVKRFYEKFKDYGLDYNVINPTYGLTEAVLAVSMYRRNEPFQVIQNINGDGRRIVGCGRSLCGYNIAIVDDDGNMLGEDVYGEVIVSSDAVTKGYISKTENSDDLFLGKWLKTGDIGFIHDGILYINGRKKEMFIVRGHNYMIHDIEEDVMKPGCFTPDKAVLCSDFDHDKNQEVLILFLAVEKNDEIMEQVKNVSKGLLSKYGFTFGNVVFISEICRTGSGKVDRIKLVRLLKEQSYLEKISISNVNVASKNKKNSLSFNERVIGKIWSEVLEMDVESIDDDVSFSEYGGNSVKQYQLLEKLNKEFYMELKPTFLRDYSTVKEMAEKIMYMINEDEISETKSTKKNEDIAVTGVSFRLPGADDYDELWELLKVGKNSVAKVSDKRKQLLGVDKWDNWIGEVHDVDMFDADFFDMTEKEAIFTDPQQRLILETAYEALEDAAEAYIGEKPRNVGVYSALDNQLYLTRIIEYIRCKGMDEVPENTLIGNLNNIASARISHFFNFNGPAMSIDSACSSFLVALHSAKRSMQLGEINAAVISSAHLILAKEEFLAADKAGILSSSDKSKVFDKDADGSVLGEGVISIYVEPMKKALEKKKHIYGVIKGSAINNDGYSLSIMAPNSEGQYEALKNAYIDAGMSSDDITYLEAHGTGTRIGDPIEFRALVKLFTERTKNKLNPGTIGIGSIKSNIGHLLPAASGAGIVKVLGCLENKKLVPSINMENINPALGIHKTPFYVVTEPVDWEVQDGKKRTAGITSLGLGGTNAHMIIQESPLRVSGTSLNMYPMVISAKTKEALEKKKSQLLDYIGKHIESLGDICYTLCSGRTAYEYRAACVLHKFDIDGSIKNMKSAEYSRVRSPEIYIDLGNVSVMEDSFAALKKNIAPVIKLIKNLNGILIRGDRYSVKEWETGNLDKKSETVSVPRNAVVISVNGANENAAISVETNAFSSREGLFEFLNSVFLNGNEVNWEMLEEFGNCGIVSLPKYPFDNKSYWLNW